jgi:hypothetical protein
VLLIFIALKKTTASAGFEPANLASNGKHTKHYTTEATLKIHRPQPGLNLQILGLMASTLTRRLPRTMH